MVRIAITQAAYDAICATLPLGSVGYEAEANERGERLIWLETAVVDRLGAMREPVESYSDFILRIAGREGDRLGPVRSLPMGVTRIETPGFSTSLGVVLRDDGQPTTHEKIGLKKTKFGKASDGPRGRA